MEDGIELKRNLTVINTITQLEIMEWEINVNTHQTWICSLGLHR